MFEIVGGVDIPQGDTGRDRDWEGTVGKEAPILKMRENSVCSVSEARRAASEGKESGWHPEHLWLEAERISVI